MGLLRRRIIPLLASLAPRVHVCSLKERSEAVVRTYVSYTQDSTSHDYERVPAIYTPQTTGASRDLRVTFLFCYLKVVDNIIVPDSAIGVHNFWLSQEDRQGVISFLQAVVNAIAILTSFLHPQHRVHVSVVVRMVVCSLAQTRLFSYGLLLCFVSRSCRVT